MLLTAKSSSHISPFWSAVRPLVCPISFSLFNPSFLFRGPLCRSAPPLHRWSRRIFCSVMSCYLRKSSVASQPSFLTLRPQRVIPVLSSLFSFSPPLSQSFPSLSHSSSLHSSSLVHVRLLPSCVIGSYLPSDDRSLHKHLNSPLKYFSCQRATD